MLPNIFGDEFMALATNYFVAKSTFFGAIKNQPHNTPIVKLIEHGDPFTAVTKLANYGSSMWHQGNAPTKVPIYCKAIRQSIRCPTSPIGS